MVKYLPLFLICIACTSKTTTESAISDSATTVSDSVPSIPAERINSLVSILDSIPEVNLPLSYDEQYFNNYDTLNSLKDINPKRLCTLLSAQFIPDSVFCETNANFIWKKSFDTYTLINFVTTYLNTKGWCFYHHLVTVNNKGEVIDLYPEWAAYYSVSVENPNGGTSAGEEIRVGDIQDNPVIRITSLGNGMDRMKEISADGHFVEPGIQFEAESDLSGDENPDKD
jgi:hypothetical protein